MRARNNVIIGWLFISLTLLISCNSKNNSTDVHSSPEALVCVLFEAAKIRDFNLLYELCDPFGENDSNTKDICNLSGELEEPFVEYFKNGKLSGKAIINGDEAEVPFTFGPDGSTEETMICIRRDGKWYLYRF